MYKEENQGKAVKLQLKSWRVARQMSQYDLHLCSGVARNEISEIETGKRDPVTRTLARLGAAMGCAPHKLWGMPEEP